MEGSFLTHWMYESVPDCGDVMSRSTIYSLQEAKKFFRDHYSHEFTTEDKMEFMSFWFLLIIISDILTIAGSGVKMAIRLGVRQLFVKWHTKRMHTQITCLDSLCIAKTGMLSALSVKLYVQCDYHTQYTSLCLARLSFSYRKTYKTNLEAIHEFYNVFPFNFLLYKLSIIS